MMGQNQKSSSNLLDEYYTAINKEIALDDRKIAANKMLLLLKENAVDSLVSKGLLLMCDLNSKQKKFDSAHYYSNKLLDFAIAKKDTTLLVKGYFRKGYYFKEQLKNLEAFDAYTKGINYAIMINDSVSATKMLSNKSNIQNDIGDFYGAQTSATKGLNYLTKENKTSEIILNNSLGTAFSSSNDFINAETVYLKTITLANTPHKKAMTLNNLAIVYRKQKEFEKATNLFSEILKDSININNPLTVARLKDNLGYSLFQWKGNQGLPLMLEALEIRKNLKDFVGQFASNIHLVNYYYNKKTPGAIQYAHNAMWAANKVNNPDMRLEALSYLIKLQPTKKHATEYVALNDSITTANLITQNKYAGILFKTEEQEKLNLQLQKENTQQELQIEKENLRKWIFGLGLLVVVLISFFIWRKYKTEAQAKKIISQQKDKIEHQKNTVEKLQKELHHRLKNNLSVIDLFITLAKGKFKDKEYQEKLSELQNRINSMFAIHTQLIKKEDITLVNAQTYIKTLTKGIEKVYRTPSIKIKHQINNEEKLETKLSFPIGLIINEFVTNSYKYAFQKYKKGQININLKSDYENYYLNLSDNGKGLPKDFDIEKLTSFGMDIIQLLVEEYHGKFQLNSNEGVQITIILPKTN